MEERPTVVFYASPGAGHLTPIVELGKRFLRLNPSFSIIILLPPSPSQMPSTASSPYIQRITSSCPSISFHPLPQPTGDDEEEGGSSAPSAGSPIVLSFRLLRLLNPLVRQFLIPIASSVRALIFDFFCYPILDIAGDFPRTTFYCFFPSPASALAVLLYLPTIHRQTNASFNELGGAHLSFPGREPILARDMPKLLQERDSDSYRNFLALAEALTGVTGILVNTFEALEERPLEALRSGASVPGGRTPPIHCVGPLTAEGDGGEENGTGAECLNWLDHQPSQSVVFLCFGSMGTFSAAQLKETAEGLEKSGQSFLWVVRNPKPSDDEGEDRESSPPELDALLPEGFLERTRGKGLVVKSWAPQVAVLSHGSVGGFVTHCGWNSLLEGMCAGVPMLAWSLYAEQRLNCLALVEAGLLLALDAGEDGWVTSEEVERKVRQLMEAEEGEALRRRTVEMKEKAALAIGDGGPSLVELAKLTQFWMGD